MSDNGTLCYPQLALFILVATVASFKMSGFNIVDIAACTSIGTLMLYVVVIISFYLYIVLIYLIASSSRSIYLPFINGNGHQCDRQ